MITNAKMPLKPALSVDHSQYHTSYNSALSLFLLELVEALVLVYQGL